MAAKILAVDDSPSLRVAVKIALAGAGYDVDEAADGSEGLQKASGTTYDMIITDLNMPIMDGLTMIERMRQLPQLAGVPIVFLTTESDAGMKARAKAAGATGWLTKPFQPEGLVKIVKKVLGQ
jgi:two-component system chemotaxis response regulator CheY